MSNYAILRVGKLKSSASIRGMLKHNFRTIDTPNADESLTDSNEHIDAQSVEDGMRIYRGRLPEKVRKNAVHAIEYMVTTSSDADAKDKLDCLSEAYDWISEKHGKENIIMASKHFDETTPHLHVLVLPIDEKNKLNARSFIGGTKHKLSELQDEFIERLHNKKIMLNRGIQGSKAKHQNIKDWNAKKLRVENLETENFDSMVKPEKNKFGMSENTSKTLARITELARDQNTKLINQQQTIDENSKFLPVLEGIKKDVRMGKTGGVLDKFVSARDEKRAEKDKLAERISTSKKQNNDHER